jgi:hypothetical protein
MSEAKMRLDVGDYYKEEETDNEIIRDFLFTAN